MLISFPFCSRFIAISSSSCKHMLHLLQRKCLAANKPARQPHLWLGRDFMLPRAVSWPCLAGSTLCVLLVLNLAGHTRAQAQFKVLQSRTSSADADVATFIAVSHTCREGLQLVLPKIVQRCHCKDSSSMLGAPKAGWVLLQSCKMHGLEQHHEAAQADASRIRNCCRVGWQS